MAHTLRSLAEVLKSRSIGGNSHEQYDKHWRQCCTWCLLMQVPIILTKKDANENTAQLGACCLLLSLWDEYEEERQPTWHHSQQNFSYPLAPSVLGGIRASSGFGLPAADAGHQTYVRSGNQETPVDGQDAAPIT